MELAYSTKFRLRSPFRLKRHGFLSYLYYLGYLTFTQFLYTTKKM